MNDIKNKIHIRVEDQILDALLRETIVRYFPAVSLEEDDGDHNGRTVILHDDRNDGFDDQADFTIRVETPLRIGMLLSRLDHCLSGQDHLMQHKGRTIIFGPYQLLAEESRLVCSDRDDDIRLTEKERDILLLLCKEIGATIDRSDLLSSVWGYAGNIETHTLETHIYRLRQKIEENPAQPAYLLTDGTGYKITA